MDKREPDQLAKDAAAARAAGMSYGKWKALQGERPETKKEIPEGWRICVYCGKPFKPATWRKQLYCEAYCQKRATEKRYKAQKRRRKSDSEDIPKSD